MNLNELISQHLPEELLQQISNQAGIQDTNTGINASKSIVHTLLQGLANNSQSASGLQGLMGAIDRDHDGSILNDVMGMLGGSQQAPNAGMMNGIGILGHILGNRQGNVTGAMGKIFNLDPGTIMKLMTMLAPIVMGMLGKMRSNQQLSENNAQDIFGQVLRAPQAQEQNTGFGIFGKLLDQDNDGNITDDLLQMGMNIFMKR